MALHQDPVLVTGGSGYIASWIVKKLIQQGYNVRATVRDQRNPEKVAHLMEIAAEGPGVLELVEADLLEPGSFSEGMQNCRWVIHTASPFVAGKVKDAQAQLVDPALRGTRNVLESVNATPSVQRVVLTSSVAAVAGDNVEIRQTADGVFTEEHWNQSSTLDHQPYPYSKTVAEKEAWQMAEAQDRWQLLVINPSFVMGPPLSTRRDAASIDVVRNLLKGQLAIGAPQLTFGIVDVREVADAHIQACEKPQASGRHILAADHLSLLDIGQTIAKFYGDRFSKLPKREIPKWLTYLIAPAAGFTWRFVTENVGEPPRYDNRYSIQDLGLKYRPVQQTLQEMVGTMIERGMV